MNEKAYEEIGPNHRFFLAWRHAVFAGELVVLWGTCSLLTSAHEKGLVIAGLIPILASLATFCLWLADRRTRQIYRSLTEAGKTLEGSDPGPYHALTAIGIPRDAPWFPNKNKTYCKLFSQLFAVDCFFLGSTVVLLAAAILLLIHPPTIPNPIQPIMNQGVQLLQ
jgi:hypothetical protein